MCGVGWIGIVDLCGLESMDSGCMWGGRVVIVDVCDVGGYG